jgi:site-specific recombinase XerD
MPVQKTSQWTITKNCQDTDLLIWVDAFIGDRKAQGLSPGTIYFYTKKLQLFLTYCNTKLITNIMEITPNDLRGYMLHLEYTGHNKGGRHACYRVLKTFLLWWENEIEPENWSNPIRKVKAPKLNKDILEPAEVKDIRAILETCNNDFYGLRDRAIILALVDTGARASELLSLDLVDINLATGSVMIHSGKGGKQRTVFLGRKSRKALRLYLKKRKQTNDAVWITKENNRLAYAGLRSIIRRRSERAGVECPQIHSFRRLFALTMLRNGVDVYSLQRLMVHADLQVLRRYLAQTDKDSMEAHRKGAPVDGML